MRNLPVNRGFDYHFGFPCLVNDAKSTEILMSAAGKILGSENVDIMPKPVMGGEDFAYFTQEVPSAFIFLGVAEEDEQADLDKIVKKVTELRIFKDDAGKTNLSLQDVNGELLIVSQFTLLADCKKGRRPSFVKAGNPQKAEEMYEEFIRVCKEKVPKVEHGVFGADMKVELLNDGPFTIVLDSKEL